MTGAWSSKTNDKIEKHHIFISHNINIIEQQIRRLQKRFRHAFVSKLGNLLDIAGYTQFRPILTKPIKICELCRTYCSAPRRFKFSLRD